MSSLAVFYTAYGFHLRLLRINREEFPSYSCSAPATRLNTMHNRAAAVEGMAPKQRPFLKMKLTQHQQI